VVVWRKVITRIDTKVHAFLLAGVTAAPVGFGDDWSVLSL
jgi:hypothetical protein